VLGGAAILAAIGGAGPRQIASRSSCQATPSVEEVAHTDTRSWSPTLRGEIAQKRPAWEIAFDGSWRSKPATGRKASIAVVFFVTPNRSFGSALNHHVHLHACVTDGVFMPATDGTECDAAPVFLTVRPITKADLATLTERMRRRIVRCFKRRRFLDAHSTADMLPWENSGFSIDASVRIALFRLQLRVYCQPLEHLLRYCARPPFALERLSVARDASGHAEHWQARRGRDRPRKGALVQMPSPYTDHPAFVGHLPILGLFDIDRDHDASNPRFEDLEVALLAPARVGHPPTGASSCRPMTIATSFKRCLTNCRRSTSTASERCRTRGENEAARRPDSEKVLGRWRFQPRRRSRHPRRDRLFQLGAL
jgi:hypothetical protein